MGNINLNCLRKWIEQKVSIKLKAYVITIVWKSLHCELCKAAYPFAVCFDGNIYEVIKIPFVVFEIATKRRIQEPFIL
jgi:hypothetical protein